MPDHRAIGLDHNATTPVDPRVLERFVAVERDFPGNPASLHGAGRRARGALEAARAAVAAALDVPIDGIVFTSGGTEANNLAVRGLGDPSLPVLLAPTEHPSVREPALARGAVWWQTDAKGRALVAPPDGAVGMVALVHAQSELGTVQPVVAAAALAHELRVPLHVDAAQTLGRLPMASLGRVADTLAISTHKCGGLRGSGVLCVRDPSRLRPLLLGGGQESGLRPGTVSPALAAAAALAIELAVREQAQRAVTMAAARAAFLTQLHRAGAACVVLTPLEDALPNTVMVHVPAVDGRNLLPALDLAGVQASAGAACASGSPLPPPILRACGLDEPAARACVRFSFGAHDAIADAEEAARRVVVVIASLQKKI